LAGRKGAGATVRSIQEIFRLSIKGNIFLDMFVQAHEAAIRLSFFLGMTAWLGRVWSLEGNPIQPEESW
jgi:hypothetical protein